jgi:hypothetical protein
MEKINNDTFISDNEIKGEKPHIERRGSTKHRIDNDDDEGATWSVSSNGGLSQSSHDDGFVFQGEIKTKA